MSEQTSNSIRLTTKNSAGDIRLRPRNSVLRVSICVLSLLCLLNAHDAQAATINIDFESSGQSATHQGDDGILSLSAQSVWNRVFAFNDLNPTENLVDASGESTTVSYRSIDTGGFFTSFSPPDLPNSNDLQDEGFGVSGTNGAVLFELRNLISQQPYDVALYVSESLTRHTLTQVDLEHQGGTISGLQTSSPTFSLPGLINQDYLLFDNLQPLDLGDGSWGFRFTISYGGAMNNPVASIVSGLQVEGQFLGAGLLGDYNKDGTVDAADYVVWRKNDGTSEGYTKWRTNFGATTGNGVGTANSVNTSAVPEPASLVVLLTGIPAMFFWRRAFVS